MKDCYFWLTGKCIRGGECPLRHDPAKLCILPRNACFSFYKKGQCRQGDHCSFSHDFHPRTQTVVAQQNKESLLGEEKYDDVLTAVKKGDECAKTKLAWYKLSGRGGCEVDIEGAVELLRERVKQKDAEAMWMLGVCNEFGIGTRQKHKKARKFCNKSSEARNSIGVFLAELFADLKWDCGYLKMYSLLYRKK